jgi:hypothetical protein
MAIAEFLVLLKIPQLLGEPWHSRTALETHRPRNTRMVLHRLRFTETTKDHRVLRSLLRERRPD